MNEEADDGYGHGYGHYYTGLADGPHAAPDAHAYGLVPHHFDMDLIDVPTIADHYYYPADTYHPYSVHQPAYHAQNSDPVTTQESNADAPALQNLLERSQQANGLGYHY